MQLTDPVVGGAFGAAPDGKVGEVAAAQAATLLSVQDLTVTFPTDRGPLAAVAGISYDIKVGRTLGVVGESGCGKSMTALALMGLVPPPGRVTGRILFGEHDIVSASEAELRRLRGNRIAMIFQEPMTALNPVVNIGDQIAEVLILHKDMTKAQAREEAVRLLDEVGIPSPRQRAGNFPHEMSGGMRQRGMIAMALACQPALLVADEPTTALDVTIQAQILELMLELQDQRGMAIQFISHNLGVISELADDIVVMYAGRIVERAPADELFRDPKHPYTRGLLETLPQKGKRMARLPVIPGIVPDLATLPPGCRFADRCPIATAECRLADPNLTPVAAPPGVLHEAACIKAQ